MFFSQSDFDICCEWGKEGIENVSASCDAVIIVDVLSFCTCIDIAVAREAIVYPYQFKDASASSYAASLGAILASPRDRLAGYSLSPQSLLTIPPHTRLVLPSPNCARLTLLTNNIPTFAGCLRNAKYVAAAVQTTARRICVIPAGEQWDGGGIRMAAEDLIGAGAIIHYLQGSRSPEAELAAAYFERAQADLPLFLSKCGSGKELSERGFAADISLAGALNESDCVPVLQNEAFFKYTHSRAI